jgi:sarcosine oxidase subunit delta
LDASDEAWADYLFLRDNPRGVHLERWHHTFGCGQWFNIARSTSTHEVLRVYGMSDLP